MSGRWKMERIRKGEHQNGAEYGTWTLRDNNDRLRFSAPYIAGGLGGATPPEFTNEQLSPYNDIDVGQKLSGIKRRLTGNPDAEVRVLYLGDGDKILHEDIEPIGVSLGCVCLKKKDMDRFWDIYDRIPMGQKPTLEVRNAFGKDNGRENDRPLFSGFFQRIENENKEEHKPRSQQRDDAGEKKPFGGLFAGLNKSENERPNSRNENDNERDNGREAAAARNKPKEKTRERNDDGDKDNLIEKIGKKLKEGGGEVRESRSSEAERPNAGKGLAGLFKGNRH